MALTAAPVMEATFSFKDRDNNIGRTSVSLLGTLTYEDASASALEVGARMQAVSDAQLVAITLTYKLTDPALVGVLAPETSDVERKLRFSFEGATPNLKSRIEVPSVLNTLIVDGTNVADKTNAAVAALITAVLNPTLGAGTGPVTASGDDLAAFVGAPTKIHRASSKG
jgi:hypothetical protein